MSNPTHKTSAAKAWTIVGIVAAAILVIISVIFFVTASKASPEPGPTISPTPSPTYSPTASPTASPTQTQTATPTPTVTPTPTKTTSPTPVPPGPTAAQKWADSTYGTFAPVSAQYRGNKFVSLPNGATAGIVTISNNGDDAADFNVYAIGDNGQRVDQLVNDQGDYIGTVAYGLNQGLVGAPKIVALEITSSGQWSVDIAPISAAPQTYGTNTGDDVYLAAGGTLNLQVADLGGNAPFTLTQFVQNAAGNVLVNITGYSQQAVGIGSAPSVLVVNTTSSYSLALQ